MLSTNNKKLLLDNEQKFSGLRQVKKVRKHVLSNNHSVEVLEKFRVHDSPDYSLLNEYFLLFRLLRMIGIKVAEYDGNKTNNNPQNYKTRNVKQRAVHCFENCWKYFVFSIVYARNLVSVLQLMFVKDTKVDVMRVFQSFLFTVIYTSIYRKRQAMLRISKGIGCIYRQLPNRNLKSKKLLFAGGLVLVAIILIIRLILIFGIPKNNKEFRNKFYKSFYEKDAHSTGYVYLVLLLLFIESSSFIIAIIALSIFVTYYSLTCSFIGNVFKRLLIGMHGLDTFTELKILLYIYKDIMYKLKDMDSEFSFLAFVSVLINTSGLFWYGYKIAFYTNEISGCMLYILSGTSYMILLLQLMISASDLNELGKEIRVLIQCLPQETAESQPKVNFFKKTLLQDNGLTLWKIYVMNRSLVICTFGTLLTYGIMLGTLGKYD
ncbi:uncharacterized protein TNCV_1634971 [Trichonephila clavipes]|nr:uncharacterized protein TNCV_1634971 [Trichonephila clavipes]